jgi:hypothetical protein
MRASLLNTLRTPALLAAIVAALTVGPASVGAQATDGATMTIIRGQVALVRRDGSAVQPAPSGTLVRATDEIRTIGQSGALITFFAGTEVELGADTTMVVERISRDGNKIDVSLKQAFGMSLHRVLAFSDPGSSYRVDAGGAAAIVRGTTFLVVGPTPSGHAGIVCLEDCTPRTTFAGCPMRPFLAYSVQLDRGKVVGACQEFGPKGGYWETGRTIVDTAEEAEGDGTRPNHGGKNRGKNEPSNDPQPHDINPHPSYP